METRTKEITDADRISYLEELLRHCPHAEISHNDDPDAEDADGVAPLGFTIRVEGCEISKVTAPTLRECIDKEILAAQSGEWRAEPQPASDDVKTLPGERFSAEARRRFGRRLYL